jgi:hypothetical protein
MKHPLKETLGGAVSTQRRHRRFLGRKNPCFPLTVSVVNRSRGPAEGNSSNFLLRCGNNSTRRDTPMSIDAFDCLVGGLRLHRSIKWNGEGWIRHRCGVARHLGGYGASWALHVVMDVTVCHSPSSRVHDGKKYYIRAILVFICTFIYYCLHQS